MINRAVKANGQSLLQVRTQQKFHLLGIAQNGYFELFMLNKPSGRTDLFGDAAINFSPEILHIIATKQAQKNGFHNDDCKCDLENQTADQSVKQRPQMISAPIQNDAFCARILFAENKILTWVCGRWCRVTPGSRHDLWNVMEVPGHHAFSVRRQSDSHNVKLIGTDVENITH